MFPLANPSHGKEGEMKDWSIAMKINQELMREIVQDWFNSNVMSRLRSEVKSVHQGKDGRFVVQISKPLPKKEDQK